VPSRVGHRNLDPVGAALDLDSAAIYGTADKTRLNELRHAVMVNRAEQKYKTLLPLAIGRICRPAGREL
jgi:hypothetical protein